MAVTKSEFVDRVASKSGLSKRDAAKAVDAFLDSVEETLVQGDSITFTGFGKFSPQQRNARQGVNPRTGAKVPIWGFSGSPLVVDDLVIVAASGAFVAYDLATGEPRWLGPKGPDGYCSPQLATIDCEGPSAVPTFLRAGSSWRRR